MRFSETDKYAGTVEEIHEREKTTPAKELVRAFLLALILCIVFWGTGAILFQ